MSTVCVYMCMYVHMYSMYLCTYACVCVLCVCSREISYCFKYIIIHKSLYTIAVLIDLRGQSKGILSALFGINHRVLYLRRLLTFVKASCSNVECCHCLY